MWERACSRRRQYIRYNSGSWNTRFASKLAPTLTLSHLPRARRFPGKSRSHQSAWQPVSPDVCKTPSGTGFSREEASVNTSWFLACALWERACSRRRQYIRYNSGSWNTRFASKLAPTLTLSHLPRARRFPGKSRSHQSAWQPVSLDVCKTPGGTGFSREVAGSITRENR
jgi:hypothetical protein